VGSRFMRSAHVLRSHAEVYSQFPCVRNKLARTSDIGFWGDSHSCRSFTAIESNLATKKSLLSADALFLSGSWASCCVIVMGRRTVSLTEGMYSLYMHVDMDALPAAITYWNIWPYSGLLCRASNGSMGHGSVHVECWPMTHHYFSSPASHSKI